MSSNLCAELGYVSLNKAGEELCGDRVETFQDASQSIVVLADGLGSGVKANILSTLTSKIICTMLSEGIPIDECIDTIASTLPVCKERGVAYSTFSVVRVLDNRIAELTQYDNPPTSLLRNGVRYDYPFTLRNIAGKEIREARFPVEEGDVFLLMSDGAPYAGVGKAFNYGWQLENILDFVEANYLPNMAAKSIAGLITDECYRLYEGAPGDDTTVAALRVRKRQMVNLVIGPPQDKTMDVPMMNLFFAKEGVKIVCGGTTSKIAANYLGKPLVPTLDYPDPEVPPISSIAGVDLVTEGVVTLSRVLTLANAFVAGEDTGSWDTKRDGASLIARQLFVEATDINFFVGRAINPAHQNPDLPITFGIKIQLIEALKTALEKMGKRIKVSYF